MYPQWEEFYRHIQYAVPPIVNLVQNTLGAGVGSRVSMF